MSKFILLLIIFAHIFILSKLIFFPYPELFIYPYLTNHGLKPYAQILDQHFPGLLFLPINFDNLGMNDEVSARLWLFGIVFLTHILLFLISRSILKSDKKALLVNVLYLIWQPFFEGWVLWIDNFLPLILLPAFYCLHKDRIFLTGLLLGIGIVFKQVLIPLSGLVLIYLIWEIRGIRKIGGYLLGLSLPVVLIVIYFIFIGVLKDFWYWTVIFNLTVFAKYGRGEGADFAHLSRVVLVFGTAFLALGKIKMRSVQILLIFLIGSLIGLTTRFDFVHFQPALPFAILATVYVLGGFGKLGKIRVIWVGYILVLVWWLIIFYRGHLGSKVYFFDNHTYELASKIRQYAKPYEKIFIFGAAPHLYQMSKTLPAGDIFVFQFPWFLKIAEDRILEGIKKDRVDIIVYDRTVRIEGEPITNFTKSIDEYISKNYEKIDSSGNTEILKRKITDE